MNGYGETLRSLAGHLGVAYETTPPARSNALHPYVQERIAGVDRALPQGVMPKDQALRRTLVMGLLCQDSGLPDYSDVHAARVVERLIAALEYECNCPDGENAMRRVVCTDRRGRDIVTPDQLARPLIALADETIHAEHDHLPHLLKHLNHCPSFRSGIDAVQLLEGALPAALHALVGDPRQAADWILMGETSVR